MITSITLPLKPCLLSLSIFVSPIMTGKMKESIPTISPTSSTLTLSTFSTLLSKPAPSHPAIVIQDSLLIIATPSLGHHQQEVIHGTNLYYESMEVLHVAVVTQILLQLPTIILLIQSYGSTPKLTHQFMYYLREVAEPAQLLKSTTLSILTLLPMTRIMKAEQSKLDHTTVTKALWRFINSINLLTHPTQNAQILPLEVLLMFQIPSHITILPINTILLSMSSIGTSTITAIQVETWVILSYGSLLVSDGLIAHGLDTLLSSTLQAVLR